MVSPIPEGYHSLTPYMIVDNAAEAIEFYRKAFGAEVLMRLDTPDGKVGHAEIKVGDSPIMMADEFPDMGFVGPNSRGGTTVSMCRYVPDCDAVFKAAIEAGATETKPLQDQFYGDRSGTVTDPYGHVWTIATHIEDLSPEEIAKRQEEARRSS